MEDNKADSLSQDKLEMGTQTQRYTLLDNKSAHLLDHYGYCPHQVITTGAVDCQTQIN